MVVCPQCKARVPLQDDCPRCGGLLQAEGKASEVAAAPGAAAKLASGGGGALAPSAPPAEKGLIKGRYRLEALLGEGADAVVHQGRNLKLDTLVAIKILHEHRATEAAVVERFMDEARLVSRLAHPNCPRVFDYGQDEQGRFYIVMELVSAGQSLQALLAREAPLSLPRIVHLGTQVLSVLQASHALGVVHADLKPANIFVLQPPGAAEVVKVLDFGVAQATHAVADRVLGTPEYMSPEQARG